MQDLVNRILAEKQIIRVGNSYYHLENASATQKWEAECLHEDILYELSFSGWIGEADTESILIKLGLWHKDYNDRLKNFEKLVEDLKLALFQSFFRVEKRKSIKDQLDKIKKQLQQLETRRSSLDYVTLEHYAKTLKFQYATALSIKDLVGNHIYTRENFWISDGFILLGVLKYMGENQIESTTLRKMARTEPWRSYWSIGKEKIFKNEIANLTDQQRTLAIYSKMYDSAYNHPECPVDDVIEDDDAFDGWMISQDRKRKKDMADKNMDQIVGKKHRRAGELFVPVSNSEEAQEIYKMNDLQTRMEQRQRQKVLDKKGEVAEQHLPDVQIKLRQQAHREFMARVKGKK